VVVTGIEANSPAEETDLREGDVIIEVAQTAVKTVADIERILTEQGEKRKAFLFRYVRGGNPADITVLRVNE
jgi:S1-C subfamily serine protease